MVRNAPHLCLFNMAFHVSCALRFSSIAWSLACCASAKAPCAANAVEALSLKQFPSRTLQMWLLTHPQIIQKIRMSRNYKVIDWFLCVPSHLCMPKNSALLSWETSNGVTKMLKAQLLLCRQELSFSFLLLLGCFSLGAWGNQKMKSKTIGWW